MQPLIYEIYDVDLPYKICHDIRPAIIIEVISNSKVSVALLSSAMDLIKRGDFLIQNDDPDFLSTGLKKTCYVIAGELWTLDNSDLLKRRGCLKGALLSRFQRWI